MSVLHCICRISDYIDVNPLGKYFVYKPYVPPTSVLIFLGEQPPLPTSATFPNLSVTAVSFVRAYSHSACLLRTSFFAIPSLPAAVSPYILSNLSSSRADRFSHRCAGSAHYVELSGCQSVVEVQKTIGQHAENNPDLPWVVRAV